MVPTLTIVLALVTVILLRAIYFDSYVAELLIRRALKRLSTVVPNGRYRSFSPYKPRVIGVIEGYEVQLGADIIRRRGGGLSASLFEKVKLKDPPQVSFTQKDRLSVNISNENLSIEWGWLTRYHDIPEHAETVSQARETLVIRQKQSEYKPSEIASLAEGMLRKSPIKNLRNLMDVARQLDSHSLDITTQITQVTSEAHREFLIGSIVTFCVIICYWVVWRFFLSQ